MVDPLTQFPSASCGMETGQRKRLGLAGMMLTDSPTAAQLDDAAAKLMFRKLKTLTRTVLSTVSGTGS